MQQLTAGPRSGLAESLVRSILTSDAPVVDFGLELVDTAGNVLEDLTPDLLDGQVERNCYADVHGTCSLKLSRALAWGRDRVRPFQVLSRSAGFADVSRVTRHGVVRTNLARNPSAEVDVTDWEQNSGTLTRTAAVSLRGSACVSITSGAAGERNCAYGYITAGAWRVPVVPGQPVTLGIDMRHNDTVNRQVRVDWRFHDSAGNLIVAVQDMSPTDLAPNNWQRHVVQTGVAPVNAATIRIVPRCPSMGANTTLYVDGLTAETTATDGSYFDGDTPDTADYLYEWTGTPNASTSTKTSITTTVTREPVIETARFDLGVFVLTTPPRPIGESPATYDVTGYDLLYLLQQPVGDTYVVPAGTTYLQAVRDVIAASGAGSSVFLDGTAQSTPLPGDRVWMLTDSDAATWLRIVNDLLAEIAYRGIWADESGRFRSEPYRDPALRPVEWVHDTGAATIFGSSGTETVDVWNAPNWWRGIRKGMSVQPVEGAGIYTRENVSTGPSSQDSVGRIVRAEPMWLDAADQASLVAQVDRQVATDMAVTRIIDGSTGPMPIVGHWDISTIDHPDLGRVKVQTRSWSLPLSGGDVKQQWEVVGG